MGQIMSRHALDHHCGRLFCIHASRNRDKPPGWGDRRFGIGTLHTRISDAVTGLDVPHIGSDGFHCPGSFLPEREGQGALVAADAVIDVDEIDATRLDLHPRFALSRLWHRDFFKLQGFKSTILMYPDSFHCGYSLLKNVDT